MKKFLLACATFGLAAGAGYLLYQTWKRYSGEAEENSGSETVRKTEISIFSPNIIVNFLGD